MMSASSSITVESGPTIAITSLDKTSLPPFELLTIAGTGFDPNATISVNFTDGSGFSVSVPPVSVHSNALVVGVPPHIDPSTGNLGPGTVSLQIAQALGGVTTTSNAIPGMQIQDLPTPPGGAGTVTLAFFQGMSNFITTLQSELANQPQLGQSQLATAEISGALQTEQQVLNSLLGQVAGVVQNPNQTFTLATVSGTTITVSSADLAKLDRMIFGMLAAWAAASYNPGADDQPACASGDAGDLWTQLKNGQPTPTTSGAVATAAADGGLCGQAQNAQDVVGTLLRITAGLGAGLGVAGFVLGLPPLIGAAGSAGLMIFTAATVAALLAYGGYIAKGTPAGQVALQGAVAQFNSLIKQPFKKLLGLLAKQAPDVLSKPYNWYNFLNSVRELFHALTQTNPFSGGPPTTTTQTLTVSITGSGRGTVVASAAASPGGIVCSSSSSPCSATFTTNDAVFVSALPAVDSIFQSFGQACSGNGACQTTMNTDQLISADFELAPPPPSPIIFTGTITGSIVDEGHGGCNGGAGGTASMTGTVTMTVSQLSSGGFSFTGTVSLSQGAGICDDYSGTYQFSGEVPTLNGGSTGFSFGPAFATGTFTNANSFSASWSFSVNVGPDVANGTMTLMPQ